MNAKSFSIIIVSLVMLFNVVNAQRIPNYSADIQMENLDRGFIAYRISTSTIVLSWRYLKTDDLNVAFNVYRQSIAADGTEGNRILINSTPITKATFYSFYAPFLTNLKFYLHEVHDGVESSECAASYLLKTVTELGYSSPYIEIPMRQVAGDTQWNYSPNDASFADLDGDGELEMLIHRTGTDQDNSNSGVTTPPILQAYKLDGTFMWEINLGKNIREGAHYTQFMVYDLDGDGKAELVCKTAEGGKDAAGNNIGETYFPEYVEKNKLGTRTYNADANYINSSGYILSGPEFLTVFNGETGVEIVTTEYDPPRYSNLYNNGDEFPVMNPTGSELNTRWGDSYGNRCDRFLACVAYLDGVHPSVVMCRGYYTRTVLVAYDFANGKLTKRWKFDTYRGTSTSPWKDYAGQGNHNLRVGDVDGDGFDEIIYGSCAIDHDGTGLYNTKLGHGDAMHLTDYIPERPGLEVMAVHENKVDGTTLRDAATGEIIYQIKSGDDVGRGMGTDVTASYRGMEWWSGRSDGVRSAYTGEIITSGGVSMNMACWWDGDLLRELQDDIYVTKYNNGSATTLLTPISVASNNGTKANPCFVGDVLGDWREEVVLRAATNRFVRIYMTDKSTNYRFHSFLQDPVYRIGLVTQNVAYNQPAHTGFYFGSDLEDIFVPKKIEIETDEYELDPLFDALDYQWSTGETSKKIILKREDFGEELNKIKLTINYLGYQFSDSLQIAFIQNTGVDNNIAVEPVSLVSTLITDELSVSFNQAGTFECFIYDTNGRLFRKTNFVVSSSSIHTIDADDLPLGTGIIVINGSGITYRDKFVKKTR